MRLRGIMRVMGPMGPMRPIGLMGPMGLMGLIGLIGLLGCSEASEDTSATPTEAPITFSSALADSTNVTRSETPLEQKVKAFTVFGYKNMSASSNSYGASQQVFTTGGYRVAWTSNSVATTTTNTHDWEYVGQQLSTEEEQTIKYWDWSAKAYRFFAVANVSSDNTFSGTYLTTPTPAYKVTFTADATNEINEANTPYYSHLWFSTGNMAVYPDKAFGKPVKLVFLKPLCKVNFRFIFEDPNDATSTFLTNMSFRPTDGKLIKLEGSVNITYPLEGSATAEEVAVTSADTDAAMATEGMTEDNHRYTVLPASNQGTYTLTVSVNGEPKSAVVPAEFMEWKPGVEYTYIFKIHVDKGVSISSVQSAFTQWTEHKKETTIYNW